MSTNRILCHMIYFAQLYLKTAFHIQPKITIKEGDRFAYGPWGGECVATYKNGCLRFYRKSRGVNTVVMSWQCATPDDTHSLLTGGRVNIIWDGRARLSMRVKDTNCLEVMHGRRPYYFRRMKVSLNVIRI